MRSSTIWILVFCVALGLLALGGFYILFWDEPIVLPPSESVVTEPERIESPPPPPPMAPPQPVRPATPAPVAKAPHVTPAPPAVEPSMPAPEEIIPPDLDDQLSELATSDLSDLQASQKVIAMMATLPDSNQVQAAEFLVDLLPDEGYQSVVPMLTNPKTNPDVLEVLMTDLLDRPNTIQVPLILDIARNPAHPRSAEAREVLGLYVEADHGNDWAAWEQAARKFVEENPD